MTSGSRRWLFGILIGIGAVLLASCLGLAVCGGLAYRQAMRGAQVDPRSSLIGGNETAYLSVRLDAADENHQAFAMSLAKGLQEANQRATGRGRIPFQNWLESIQSQKRLVGHTRIEVLQYPSAVEGHSASMFSLQLGQGMGMVGMLGRFMQFIVRNDEDQNSRQEDYPRGSLTITPENDGQTVGMSMNSERVLIGSAIDELRRVLQRTPDQDRAPWPAQMQAMQSAVAPEPTALFGFVLDPGSRAYLGEPEAWTGIRAFALAGEIVQVDGLRLKLGYQRLAAEPTPGVVPEAPQDLVRRTIGPLIDRCGLVFTPVDQPQQAGDWIVVEAELSGIKEAVERGLENLLREAERISRRPTEQQ
jgi:hypothetical protein